jgi:hypothetical protein
MERDARLQYLLLHIMSSVNEPLSRFPSGAPHGDDCLQSLPYIASSIPSKGALLQVPLTELPQREMLYFQSRP